MAGTSPSPDLPRRPAPASRTEPKLFYSISETADLVGVAAHVLRYWETQFKMLRPKKSRSGSRMYRPKDVELLLAIKKMLYDDGLTIAGARRRLIDGRRAERGQLEIPFGAVQKMENAAFIRAELRALAALLRRAPGAGEER